MSDAKGPHLYGTPDPKNQPSPPAAGLHGEQKAGAASHPELRHEEKLADGSTVIVEEQSGVAFAEATGAAGLSKERSATPAQPPAPPPMPAPPPAPSPAPAAKPVASGSSRGDTRRLRPYVLGLAGLAIGVLLIRSRRSR